MQKLFNPSGLSVTNTQKNMLSSGKFNIPFPEIWTKPLWKKTETEYIDLVEKIVLDREFLYNIKCKIKDKENYLYRNENAIRALEDFFEGVISDSLKSEVKN